MKRAAVIMALAALSACGDRDEPLKAPDARPGIVAKGAPADFAEPAAQAVRIEARLAEDRVHEMELPGGVKVWRLDDAVVKQTLPAPGGERTAYIDDNAVFLIRDPDAAYAFHAGRLIYAYDGDGRPMAITPAVQNAAAVALAGIESASAS